MPRHFSRRSFFLQTMILVAVSACKSERRNTAPLIIGVIDYDQDEGIIDRYTNFKQYLSSILKTHIEIEPTFNERKALERIQNQAWSLIFASPGIAAIATADFQYIPLFPLQNDITDLRSILIVREDSSIRQLSQLNGKTIALGQVGSIAGYYFPLYNLYGLTLDRILLAPTPKTIIEWVAQKKVVAGALSTKEFDLYSPYFDQKFRVFYTDSHTVPPGSILLAPTVDRTYQDRIVEVMKNAPPDVLQTAGYVPNVSVPNYEYIISVIQRVRAIAPDLNISY